MNESPIAAMNELANRLAAGFAGVLAHVTSFPSGGAMLDVSRAGRAWVMAYSPTHGFGVDELGSTEGLMTEFRFVSSHFEPVARRLCELIRTSGSCRPPSISLLVVHAHDIEQSREFYIRLGLSFSEEKHGSGPRHYAAVLDGIVFEIYPCRTNRPATQMHLGFRVTSVDSIVENLRNHGATIISEPKDSPWGRRAVVEDPDGNAVELSMPSPASPPKTDTSPSISV